MHVSYEKSKEYFMSKSVTDELIKLKELMDSGIITKREFAELKERILQSPKDEQQKDIKENIEEIDISSLKGKELKEARWANYIKKNPDMDPSIPKTNSNTTPHSKIKCPRCGSDNIQFMQQEKKAFSIGKAVGGAVLTGGIGTLAGFAGKKGKKQWFCQNCNSTFETKK